MPVVVNGTLKHVTVQPECCESSCAASLGGQRTVAGIVWQNWACHSRIFQRTCMGLFWHENQLKGWEVPDHSKGGKSTPTPYIHQQHFGPMNRTHENNHHGHHRSTNGVKHAMTWLINVDCHGWLWLMIMVDYHGDHHHRLYSLIINKSNVLPSLTTTCAI